MEFDENTFKDLKNLREEFANAQTPLSQMAKEVLDKVIDKENGLDQSQTVSFLVHVKNMCGADRERESKVSKVISTILKK